MCVELYQLYSTLSHVPGHRTHIWSYHNPFSEHSLDNVDYSVKDKLFLESFFDTEFYDSDGGKGTFTFSRNCSLAVQSRSYKWLNEPF